MKKIIDKIQTIFKNPKSRLIFSWSILAIIIFVLFICFIYSDILITTKHSINLLQTIYNGHPMGFYQINDGLIVDKFLPIATKACYELPIFIIFAIWNIPLWIAQNFFHVSITQSLISLIWLKSILVVFLVLSTLVIRKICLEIKINSKHIPWVLFVFVSSPLLLISLFIMSQYDIIAIFFMLLGIWMYVKNNFKWFIFWFSIAILLKLFALFIFIPLVLLNSKEIIKITKYLFLGLVPLLLTKLISSYMPMYKESMSGFSDDMLSKLFSRGIAVNFGSASLFCIALVAIAIFCYLKKIKDKNELNQFSIYIPLAIFSCFFMFVDFHPYWIILITPFMAIILFQNMKNFKINIILDIISSIMITVSLMVTYYWCYGPLLIERMLLPKLFGSTNTDVLKYPYISNLLNNFEITKYLPFILATYIACISAILIINFPKKYIVVEKENKIEWGLILLRLFIVIPVSFLMIFCYYNVK